MTNPTSPSDTASSALPVGTRLAEFEITGIVGEGGFGIVYSAHDSTLDRIVAVKEYLPSAFALRASDGQVQVKFDEVRKTFEAGLASFIKEAKMLARFSHPGLVEVFRYWEANGTAYMAMRYYRGVTLREMLRTTPQAVTEQWLCETLDPILLALKELHSEKCYHRDIAPDNILVLPNGRSVLMDFGAARQIIGGMTQALTTVLKPGYAPIEQYSDDGSMQQGAWTDIYAVGALLYHAMTGKVPVQAISRMMNDPIKPVAGLVTGKFSERLCAVVMKCLAVLPANRYQSIDELRAALGWVTTPGISTLVHSAKTPVSAPEAYSATQLYATTDVADIAVPLELVHPLVSAQDRPNSDPLAAFMAPAPTPVQTPSPTVSSQPSGQSSMAVSGASVDTMTSASGPGAPRRLPLLVGGVLVLGVIAGMVFFLKKPQEPEPSAAAPVVSPVAVTPNAMASAETSANVAPPVMQSQVSGPATAPDPVASAPVVADAPASKATAALSAASEPSASATVGTVRVELKDGWGTVFIDGDEKGTAPPVISVKLAPGSHDIEIRNPALPTVKRTIDVVAGKTVVVRHSFQK